MRILKFKSQLTIAFFAAVNHLNGPLRTQNFGRDPFNQNFRKFRSKSQWIGSVQPEKFRKNGSTFWGGPLFPVGPVGIFVEWIAPKDSIGEPTLSLAACSSEERKTNARGLPLKETLYPSVNTGGPPPVSSGPLLIEIWNRLIIYRLRNTYEKYGGHNLFQNAEFKANFSIKVGRKC